MDFIREEFGKVIVHHVAITRATLREAEEFKTILAKDILAGQKNIVADLTECEFIDSTFLGALVISLKKVTAIGGDLRLVGFQEAVNSMFELTRMYRVFETYKTREDAINSFL